MCFMYSNPIAILFEPYNGYNQSVLPHKDGCWDVEGNLSEFLSHT